MVDVFHSAAHRCHHKKSNTDKNKKGKDTCKELQTTLQNNKDDSDDNNGNNDNKDIVNISDMEIVD